MRKHPRRRTCLGRLNQLSRNAGALRKHGNGEPSGPTLASAFSGPDDFVFVTRKGTPHDPDNITNRVIRRAVKRAKLADPQPTFHSFRHTFASAFVAAGGDAVRLCRQLGHSSPDVTMRVYAHEFAKRGDDQDRDLIEGMYAVTGAVKR